MPGQVMDCVGNDLIDLLDTACGFTARISQRLDLAGDDSEAFSGFARPPGLYGRAIRLVVDAIATMSFVRLLT